MGDRPNAAIASSTICLSSRSCGARRYNGLDYWSRALPKALVLCVGLSLVWTVRLRAGTPPDSGLASWYGEEHRGQLMANGKRFNPDKFTAASWFYPLGSKVRVTVVAPAEQRRSVVVTITDRGPAKEFVRDGRIIDLSHAPFKKLAPPQLGLVFVAVQLVD
jgi:rare lipoprotein A (peptidoglycan hydrolase)